MHLLTILSSPTSHSKADSAKSKNRAYIVLEVPACGGFRKGDTCDKWLKVRAVAITTKSDLRIELKVGFFFFFLIESSYADGLCAPLSLNMQLYQM